MPTTSRQQYTTTTRTGEGNTPPGTYVQRGHTITTVKHSQRIEKDNKRGGDKIVKTKTRTVYYVDGKEVKLNWFDRLRIRFMSTYEKQAFLSEKLLRQEKKGPRETRRSPKKT